MQDALNAGVNFT